MPRKAKTTLSGHPAQPIGAVAGQMYGAGVEQMALQRQMPAPQVSGPVASPASAGPPPGGMAAAAPPEASAADRFAAALEGAKQMQGRAGLLTQGSNRPDEPVTAGLASGPGVGPEALQLRTGSPTGRMMRRIADLSGDSFFRELADRAKL